jgi:hypothetical protein
MACGRDRPIAGALALLRYVAECEESGDDILMVYMGHKGDEEGYGYHAMVESLSNALAPLAAPAAA